MAKKKIAINGFGRIGRLLFRQMYGHKGLEVVAINDLGDIENLAYLLKYDSVYGRFEKEVEVKDGHLKVNGSEVKVLQIKDPTQLPWKDLDIDVAVEATGVFNTYEQASMHLEAGAKKAVLTAPAKDEDRPDAKTVLLGVNEDQFKVCKITSNGSCTTNATHPVAAIMSESVGVLKAALNSVHGYTATQNLVDGTTRGSDVRKGRAAAHNIVPTTTGATISVTRAVKALEGKFGGVAVRVPVVAGSFADFTFLAKRKTTVEEINKILKDAAATDRWKGNFKVIDDPIVSSDIVQEPYGSIVDLRFTQVIDGDLVKVFSWYDNEWGYVSTLVQHIQKAAASI